LEVELMPEVVKFETVIPDGYERCELAKATHIAFGPYSYKIGERPWSTCYGRLYYYGRPFIGLDDKEPIGVVPIRKKVVEPLLIEFRPICGCGHRISYIVDKDGNNLEIEALTGKKFLEVLE
jgi:hypothetical protein